MKTTATVLLFAAVLGLLTAGPASAQVDSAQTDSAQTDSAQAERPFLRHPAVSPDGQTIAFSYQGDLWTVPVGGGRAYRLTVHEAYEAMPKWSTDGSQIAFLSDRYGNDDLYAMQADGSAPRRLTYHSANDVLGGWTENGDLVFETDRNYVQVEWENEIHRVSFEGGTPDRLLDALGYAPAPSPSGRFVVFERGANGPKRKNYRGPANRDLWLFDQETGEYAQLTDFAGNDFGAVWLGEDALLFISERSGTYNLFRQALGADGAPEGTPEQMTNYDTDGPRYATASRDGQTIAFERQTDVYVMQGSGPPKRLSVEVPADYRFDPVERKTFSSEAEEFAVSPDGKLVAFVVRGEIFLIRNDKDAKRTVQLTKDPYRDRDVAWLDNENLIFTSDREGQYDLYRLSSADAEEPSLYKTLRHTATRLTETPEDERGPVVSPDSQKVAFRRGRGGFVVADVAGGALQNEKQMLDGWATPSGVRWSPDSRYLAYSMPDLNFNHEVYIHPADGSREPVNVSKHPRPDTDPVWSPDGSKLAFVSSRSSGDDDVWFAWLQEEDWERTKRDWETLEEEEEDEEEKKDSTEVQPVEIDFDGLYERLEQVTALPGNEADPVISEDGETFFFVAGRSGRTQRYDAEVDLYKIKWDGTEQKRLTEGDQSPYAVRLSPDGKHVHYLKSGGSLARVDTEKGETEALSFQARMTIDHPEERQQVFGEAWRALEAGFYDPGFHGVDWQAMREKYRPWALEASTERDFRDVFNLMLGELNASHLGFYGSDRAETQDLQTGLLGVEINPVENGVEVVRVVPDSPADREFSKLRAGDVITAVDGQRVSEAPNFYMLLNDTADERILLAVTGADGEERDVTIRPASSLNDELYREWVEERRRLTEEYSGGRLGYIHIEGMNWSSFERFERELVASGEGKDGLLVDVRYNGGGWTTDFLLSVLTVRRHAYTVPRGAAEDLDEQQEQFRGNYPFGERLPFASWTGHVAALCNENSYSNAEIFSHAFQQLGLGPLVGQPTFGAVISTGGVGLMDGSYVRLPFRGWYVYESGNNMENTPATPDILVENEPDSRALGTDEQLRAAVEALLEDISEGRQARSGLSGETPTRGER